MKSILVLMSTYNGEKYLETQIESVLAQKNVKVHIMVRDDGSMDRTVSILEEYQNRDKLKWYSGENMGPSKSFLNLVYNANTEFDYYAFCDQDDYWEANKLYEAVEKLKEYDEQPALYHCELEIVDMNLNRIKVTKNYKKSRYIDQTLMIFFVPGCTMVFNNYLMRKVQEKLPNYNLITMHDCWIYYICLGIGGKIVSDEKAYIKYRQHGNNAVGANRITMKRKIQMICNKNDSPRAKMIEEIIRLYGKDMEKKCLLKYEKFAEYPKSVKARGYFLKQSTEGVFSMRELEKAKLRILFRSL